MQEYEQSKACYDRSAQEKYTNDMEIVARAVLGSNRRGNRIWHDAAENPDPGRKRAACTVAAKSEVFYALFPEKEPWSQEEMKLLSDSVHAVVQRVGVETSHVQFYKENSNPHGNIKYLVALGKRRAHNVLKIWERHVAIVHNGESTLNGDRFLADMEKKLIHLCQVEMNAMHRVRNYTESKN